MTSGIVSTWRLADVLETPHGWLLEIAEHSQDLYSSFISWKAGRQRPIDRPEPVLDRIQKTIYRKLLREFAYDEYVSGGVPGKTLADALERHSRQPVVISIDIRSFYPSITHSAVFGIWRRLGHGTDVSRILTLLTTYRGALPQGASPSMALANVYMVDADREIARELIGLFGPRLRYSRWVDDLIISGLVSPGKVMDVVASALRPLGLRPHRGRKRRVMRRGERQYALNLNLDRRITVPKTIRARLRAAVHQAVVNPEARRDQVIGRLRFLDSFHPGEAARHLRHLKDW